jgi:hypothetical protein
MHRQFKTSRAAIFGQFLYQEIRDILMKKHSTESIRSKHEKDH